MRRTERVVHINIAEFSQGFGKRRIVSFFPRKKTNVLDQRDIALFHMGDDFFRNFPDRFVAERNRVANQCVQVIRDRPKRILRDRLPLRSPEMRH